jgi:Amt family ammonium transporter
MIRRKNALSMLMQTLTGLGIGSLLWFSVGFTLTFGPSQRGIIGNFDYAFLLNVGIDCCFPLSAAKTLPGILFATFQMMFALMVPVIVTGAWAERMEFKAFLWFALLWPFLVYYPLAHWIWNQNGWLAELGVLDFAGGLTIHSSTGVAALVVSSILSGRMKNTHNLLGHHNLPMFVLGGALIWGGWYSFNAGSAYTAGPQAAAAMLNSKDCWLFDSTVNDWIDFSIVSSFFFSLSFFFTFSLSVACVCVFLSLLFSFPLHPRSPFVRLVRCCHMDHPSLLFRKKMDID